MNTIVLIGMMGAGKTTVATELALLTNKKFADTDKIIEQNSHMNIKEIFEKYGEQHFRELEKKALAEILHKYEIISIGGGAFENENTRKFLLKHSIVIYLKTSPGIIFERIKNDKTRPLLTNSMNLEKINEILNNREKNYLAAHKIVITDNKKPLEVAQEILENV